ncbi:MAG TPA: TIGR02186 family protein [Rhizomicrobium sp.]|nr:TIGR02186 family protein [Rhizomicrobium sp.]
MMRGALAAVFCLAATAAAADDLVSGLSQDQIQITSSYTGTDIVVFGAIESSDAAGINTSRDVVVVVRGPGADMVVRRKVRVAGVWINRDAMTLFGMPAYYFVASTRPLKDVTAEETRERYQLGLADVEPQSVSTHTAAKAEPFRLAAIRGRARDGLYRENPAGVEFLSYSLFRVRVPVPATVPRGQYTAEVYLFHDGTVISAQSTPLYVEQVGLERQVFSFAHDRPFLYGLAAVLLAVLLGWLSSVVFRQRGT